MLTVSAVTASALDFTAADGEPLRDAQLLKTAGGTAYIAHTGGVAEVSLTPEVIKAFGLTADGEKESNVADLIKAEVEKQLMEIKGGGRGALSSSPNNWLLIVSAEKIAAYKAAVGEQLDKLETVTGETYTGVIITKVNQAYLYFSHDKGAARALISNLPEEWARRFDFSPVEAAAFIEDEQKKKNLAEEQRMQNDGQSRRVENNTAGTPPQPSASADRRDIAARKLALERRVAEILNKYENRGRTFKRTTGGFYSGQTTANNNYYTQSPSRYRYDGNSWSPRNPMSGNISVSFEARELYDEWLKLDRL